ncbi:MULTISPECIES: type II toxin-antitoxin system HicA family toxin [Gammaproteobacteria]|uniref:type II toxin-antitoxin system HicA family toxin n=1 Tax=Gammaproteobacteria TaxID=1236 RepID=UPI001ADCC126|nr:MULTISPECIES: type II toxin-antitoxin system HicA family toxin [Gammaproteobacteria]MBO9483570.1 type II toxin-antitoxin system HicA family toxin [Salinisphaera sp. G21_0]MBO9496342.1 type II toxin-antitoxin system HicA family toxin [Thalassotalea sp. G20_0]
MNRKHAKTLEAIFAEPVNGNLEWRKVEALLVALGAERTEPGGSAVSFVLNGVRADFHRPHPDKASLRYRIKDARRFLENAGVKP